MSEPSPPLTLLLQQALTQHRQGQLAAAALLYARILQAEPDHFDALHLSGMIALSGADYPRAEAFLRQAVHSAPRQAGGHASLALLLQAIGQGQAALASYERALALAPAAFEVWYNRGNLLQELHQSAAAIDSYDTVLRLQPDYADALNNRGLAYWALRRSEAALADYDLALQAAPRHTGARNNRGVVLQHLNRHAEALDNYAQALACEPDALGALVNRGIIYQALQQYPAALADYERALQIAPNHIEALNNRGTVLQQLHRHADALVSFERVLELAPTHHHAAAQAIHRRQYLCQWDGLGERISALRHSVAQAAPGSKGAAPFILLTLPATAAEQQHCARHWAAEKLAPLSRAPAFSRAGRDPERPLRIGYLSNDFHEHATARLLVGVIEAHRQQGLACILYSYGPDDGSALRRRLQAGAARFEDIRALSDQAAAEKIHADGIDILIDLKGYTGGSRSEILALRAAPIQVQFLGYPGTMGSNSVDYLIADRYVIPSVHFAYYDEQIVHLPGCYQPNDPQRPIDAAPTRLEAGLPAAGFVFCCFNQHYKMTAEVFDCWMRLLQALPASVLWLLAPDAAQTAENLRRVAQNHGVAPERLIFAPALAPAAHLARLALADLFLDTTPYNAHTTASDALWVGLPVLTCLGQTFAARVAGSLLHALGLEQLIADDGAHYERLAFELASEAPRLTALRAQLAVRRASAALFDAADFAANLGTAYAAMWQRYLRGEPPSPLTVAPARRLVAPLAAQQNSNRMLEAVIANRQSLCQWDGLPALWDRMRSAVAHDTAPPCAPFTFLGFPNSGAQQQRCARQWAREHLKRETGVPASANASAGQREPGRRLRIGYLSSDLRQHATAQLMAGVFEAHRDGACDCIAYSYGRHDDSPMYHRLRAAFTRFEDISALSDPAAAAKIAADGIDILIDLKGYTSQARSAILAYRAAPIQVQFLGYPGTMGSSLIDYVIADRFVIPPTEVQYYDEQIVSLPDCYQPNDPQRAIGPAPSRSEAGLPPQGFVFCCFNFSYKIMPSVFQQWLRLLEAVPHSVLWLLDTGPRTAANLRREAQARGIDGARLIFAAMLPLTAHLGRLTLADLCLDTAPYNAHTTASDALWAGVPLLTCAGQTFASRVAGSLLQACGLPELITYSAGQYEQVALELACAPDRLAALKHKLAANRLSTPLFDAQRFARHLEAAYRIMWQRWEDGAPAAPISVARLPLRVTAPLGRQPI